MAEEGWDKDEWYRAIGELNVSYEHAKLAAVVFLLDDLQHGTKSDEHEAKLLAVVQYLPANALEDMIGGILLRSSRLGPEEQEVLKRFKKLTEDRNRVIHAPWFMPKQSASEIDCLKLHKPKNVEPHGKAVLTKLELEKLIAEAKSVSVAIDKMYERLLGAR